MRLASNSRFYYLHLPQVDGHVNEPSGGSLQAVVVSMGGGVEESIPGVSCFI